jgi:hypothetical protein
MYQEIGGDTPLSSKMCTQRDLAFAKKNPIWDLNLTKMRPKESGIDKI